MDADLVVPVRWTSSTSAADGGAPIRAGVKMRGFEVHRPEDVELDHWPATTEILSGSTLAGHVIHRSADLHHSSGILEVTPGTVSGDILAPEVSYIVRGRMTVFDEDGASHEVGPGDLVLWHKGARLRWEVHESLLIVYHSTAD